ALDRRVDVYGLGVTLYWLLTERRPFDAATTDELIPQILAGAFEAPRQVAPSLPAPLEAIVLRAMAPSPEDRYPTAAAMAADLRRHLDGEVVEAYAAGLAYRWTRWVLRHRALVAVTSVALVVLLFGLATFGILTQRAKTVADWRRGQAESLLGFMIGDLRTKLAPFNRLEVLEEVGNRALAYFRSVPADELTPDELAQRSKALYQIGDVRLRQGKLDAAHEAFEESRQLAEDLHRRDPDRLDWLFELGQSQFWIGYVDFERGTYTAALDAFGRYLDIGRRLVEAAPDHLAYHHELAYGHDNVGRTLERLRRWEAARDHFERQTEILRRLIDAEPAKRLYRAELAVATILLGTLQRTSGDAAAAEATYHRGTELLETLSEEQPEHHDWRLRLGTAHSYLGALAEERDRLDDALHHYDRQRELHAALAEADPDHAEWHAFTAKAWISRARVLRWLGRTEPAARARARAAEILDRQRAHEADHPTLREYRAILGIELAAVDIAAGRWQTGRGEADASLAVFAESMAGDRFGGKFIGRTHMLLARAAEIAGEIETERAHWLAALRSFEPLDELPHRGDLTTLAAGLDSAGLDAEASRVLGTLGRLGR
ncbi:MAG: hypothetical protein AAGE94_21700, partial [Acidobacteriota bacterium]